MNKYISCFIAVLTLCGCSASGSMYGDISPPPVRGSQLVIYKMPAFVGSADAPMIVVNGKDSCNLPNGGFFFHETSPGKTHLKLRSFGMNLAEKEIQAGAGKRVFIRVSPNSIKTGMAGTAGLAGLFAYNAAAHGKEDNGAYIFEVVSKERAEKEIDSLKQSLSCK